MSSSPSFDHERELFARGFTLIGALDEVGTGAAAGPCCCGLVIVTSDVGETPAKLKDSKLLSPSVREGLVPEITAWVREVALGWASAQEIDEVGLTRALRLAGQRALSSLRLRPDVVLLDGKRDWLSPAQSLSVDEPLVDVPPVVTMVKADRHCASVAAASVVAKVARDETMVQLDRHFPEYRWRDNKGYATAAHLAAVATHGLSEQHRRSWRLPGFASDASDPVSPQNPV